MGVQKTYGYATSKGIAGGIFDAFHYPVDSRTNAAASGKLTFGMGVVPGDTPGSNVTIPTASSKATDFEGVLVNGFDRQQDLEGKLYILNGRVWASCAVAVSGSSWPMAQLRPMAVLCTCWLTVMRLAASPLLAAWRFRAASSVRPTTASPLWSCTAFLPRLLPQQNTLENRRIKSYEQAEIHEIRPARL